MKQVKLHDYEMTGLLGSGADYEVRSAIERETGKSVILKRPEPQMVRRQLHQAIETRTDRMLEVYPKVGEGLSTVTSILGYTERCNHDAYFGDELGHDYRVMVEERAKGIPLVGDAKARFKGVPIGVGQNLFALFPLIHPQGVSPFCILNQLMDVESAFVNAGYLLLDLRPSNVFYQPQNGQLTVIDCGALTPLAEDHDPRGKPLPQLHDFYIEMLKFYITPQLPPTDAKSYRDPQGLRPVINVERELDQMARPFDTHPNADVKASALQLINRVRQHAYPSLDDFRRDVTTYTEAVQLAHPDLPNQVEMRHAWTEALEWLRADYWKTYLFDADADLAPLTA